VLPGKPTLSVDCSPRLAKFSFVPWVSPEEGVGCVPPYPT